MRNLMICVILTTVVTIGIVDARVRYVRPKVQHIVRPTSPPRYYNRYKPVPRPTPTPSPKPECPAPPKACTCNCNCTTERKERDDCTWELAFKAVKGNGRDVFADFTGPGTINEDVLQARDLTSSLPYKGSILNSWNTGQSKFIKQAKVEVFQKGARVAWFLFDAVGSSRTSWFSQNRLIASPYPNLKDGTFTFFSVEGKASAKSRFYINENDGPCADDCGYLVVVDKGASQCPWHRIEEPPYFLYNPKVDECCEWNSATSCTGLKADIVFVLDVSGSIDDSEFAEITNFVENIVSALTIGTDAVQIGAMSFGSDTMLDFKLNEFLAEADVLSAVGRIANRGGMTDTAAALTFLKDTMFAVGNGDRIDIPDVVILLTDGRSTSDSADLTAAISQVKSQNYLIFTVGIGNGIDQAELNAISSNPDSTFSLTVTDFSNLGSILDMLLNAACIAASPPQPLRSDGSADEDPDKVADVFAISVKTCDIGW